MNSNKIFLIHVSRRLPRRVRGCTIPIDVNIDVQVKTLLGTVDTKTDIDVQMIDKKHTVKKHVRSEEENRCKDEDVCDHVCRESGLGDAEDDKNICVRSDDQNFGGSQDVGSFEGQAVGCFEDREGATSNVGSFPSSPMAR